MKTITLTQNKVAIVDDADFDELNKFKWCAHNKHKKNGDFYAVRHNPSGTPVKIKMHREIMGVIDGSILVDHINGDTLDNRKSNLRTCTKKQNLRNKKGYGSSMYLGVGWDARREKWYSEIRTDGVKTFLGRFENEDDAARAYDFEANKRYGEFANLNFKSA